jgi:hypothetical protein
MVHTYFEIGRYIVEDEQQGEQRAEYGKAVLKELSAKLTERFGNGFSVENLKFIRNFFLTYEKRVNSVYPIRQTVSSKSQTTENQYDISIISSTPLPKRQFTLSWSHYLVLMRIKDKTNLIKRVDTPIHSSIIIAMFARE